MARIALLWFGGCPNYPAARALIGEVAAPGVKADVRSKVVADDALAGRTRFPGSPTIRVADGDIDPREVDCDDCTPRCRVYQTSAAMQGVPGRWWLLAALSGAAGAGTAV